MPKQLRMVRPHLDGLPEIEVPVGYAIRTYREGDDVHWVNVINAAFKETFTTFDFYEDIGGKPSFSPEGLYFATFQDTPVATTYARLLVPGESEMGSVHMVAVTPDHTGHRLGRSVTLSVLQYFQQRNFKCAILGTDDFRLPAIKTYLNLDFVPVYIDVDHPERWRKIFPKLGLPVMPDQTNALRCTLSEELWAKISG
ncbi:MAG: GNAT family N-acetyltransferase [Candidatus Poribacteria bacterium]|nr:GNAT family N-acetyltransferase [Candidatus Poribacteria bacterium]MDE0502905.1 GNAT family N-acetyltransferase [Candidatus Poribacteria bacterium]